MPAFMQQFRARWLRGDLPFSGGHQRDSVLQISLRDEGVPDETHVLAFADFIPPIALSMFAAPTPWLFRVNDHLALGNRHHVQLQMALARQFGSAVQDVGIMQVYYPIHRGAVCDPLVLLDPRTNISVAATILREGMRETRDQVLGLGYYHRLTPALARDYGTAVMTVYQRLKHLYLPGTTRRIVAHHAATACTMLASLLPMITRWTT